MDICVLCKEGPVEPASFVILAIGIIVSELCAPHFVTHENHGHTRREHRGGQKVLDLAVSELFHSGIVGGTFNAAVPASVVVCAIAVVFAIRLIVLSLVRDEVVQCEAVMARHIVNTLDRKSV